MYLVKTPFWLKWLYPNLIWNRSRQEKVIYLTFDDGPIPIVTPFVLKTLKKFKAKASFFCIGDNIRKHPEVFQQIIDDGHAVGNHTFHHLNGWTSSNKSYLKDIAQCDALINSNLFRPPYGRIKRSQISEIKRQFPKMQLIMWDILSHDYLPRLKPEVCFENVIKQTTNGSIVVFHDSLKAQERLEYVLPKALDYWTKKGYQFKVLAAS
ncbi:MAG: hypothetical protein RLZ47_992 [Bacteroidota bacterium]|jgi:peptidoglycan/xylan/chitin deacetylase (PgdA/CDA1 family)